MTIERPTWTEYWLLSTYWISQRSHDEQCKCGCVIVSPDNTLVSQGFNGFIGGIDDSDLPRTRPEKYPYMIHAEHNAILLACRQGRSVKDCTAYVSGEPCISCLQYMWQAGIRDVVFTDFSVPKMNEEDKKIREVLLMKMGFYIGRFLYQFVPSNELRYSLCVKTK